MERAVIEAKLRENRKRREKADKDLTAARRELQKLLGQGKKSGVDVSAMAKAAGVSRDTAHRLIRTA